MVADHPGGVTYVVISSENILGLSGMVTPVPISAFEPRWLWKPTAAVVQLGGAQIENAPHFAEEGWPPDFKSAQWESWDSDAQSYYEGAGLLWRLKSYEDNSTR